MPAHAVTTLRQYRGGRVAFIHGRNHPAATKPYRSAPIVSTHHPRSCATEALRTRSRNASTSMSNRAPSSLSVRVRRATHPSTASRARAGTASPTSSATGTGSVNDVATSAVTSATRVERTAVIVFAHPKGTVPLRRNPLARSAFDTRR